MDGSEGRGWVGARAGDGWELEQGMYEWSQDRWWIDRVRTGVKGWERGQGVDGS